MSVEGLINNLKTLKTLGNPGIKHLKLGKLFYGTHEHFEDLKSLLHFITMALMCALQGVFTMEGALRIVSTWRHSALNIFVLVVGSTRFSAQKVWRNELHPIIIFSSRHCCLQSRMLAGFVCQLLFLLINFLVKLASSG